MRDASFILFSVIFTTILKGIPKLGFVCVIKTVLSYGNSDRAIELGEAFREYFILASPLWVSMAGWRYDCRSPEISCTHCTTLAVRDNNCLLADIPTHSLLFHPSCSGQNQVLKTAWKREILKNSWKSQQKFLSHPGAHKSPCFVSSLFFLLLFHSVF